VALGQAGVIYLLGGHRSEVKGQDFKVNRMGRGETGEAWIPRRVVDPSVDYEEILETVLAGETTIYGTGRGRVLLPAETEIHVIREALIQRTRWAQIRFRDQEEWTVGWVPSDIIRWPREEKRTAWGDLPWESLTHLSEGPGPPGSFQTGDRRIRFIGMDKARFLEDMAPYFETLHTQASNMGDKRMVGRHVTDNSILILECSEDSVLQVLLSLKGKGMSVLEPFCEHLSSYCPKEAQSVLSLVWERNVGIVSCQGLGEIEVSHASDLTWIMITPLSSQ